MRQWTIDAFANAPFKGNPACVVEPLKEWPRDSWLAMLAQENNQTETAFLKKSNKPGEYYLRWFTPTLEVKLCGHATLAAAHTLFEELSDSSEQLIFQTKSGPLTVTRAGAMAYEMDFPANPPRKLEIPEALFQALGGGPEPLEAWAAGSTLVVLLLEEADVRNVSPDMAAIAEIASKAKIPMGELLVTGKSNNPDYDIASRFFAPGLGVKEDPATGSAHCILAPFYAEKLGKAKLTYHQAYPGRGGDLTAELRGDRVLLRGRAITIAESRLRIRPE